MIIPIRFIDNSIDEYRLKSICHNIVDYITSKYDLKVECVEFGNDFKCNTIFRDNALVFKLSFKSVITKDLFDMIKYTSANNFILSYNINSDYSIQCYIFIVLHELGHMYYNNYYNNIYKESNRLFKEYKSVNLSIKNILMVVPSNNIDSAFLTQQSQMSESLADRFAYNHFYEICSMLQSINLI